MNTLTFPRRTSVESRSKAIGGGAILGRFVISVPQAMSFNQKALFADDGDLYPDIQFFEDVRLVREPLKRLAEEARAEIRAKKAAQKAAKP